MKHTCLNDLDFLKFFIFFLSFFFLLRCISGFRMNSTHLLMHEAPGAFFFLRQKIQLMIAVSFAAPGLGIG